MKGRFVRKPTQVNQAKKVVSPTSLPSLKSSGDLDDLRVSIKCCTGELCPKDWKVDKCIAVCEDLLTEQEKEECPKFEGELCAGSTQEQVTEFQRYSGGRCKKNLELCVFQDDKVDFTYVVELTREGERKACVLIVPSFKNDGDETLDLVYQICIFKVSSGLDPVVSEEFSVSVPAGDTKDETFCKCFPVPDDDEFWECGGQYIVVVKYKLTGSNDFNSSPCQCQFELKSSDDHADQCSKECVWIVDSSDKSGILLPTVVYQFVETGQDSCWQVINPDLECTYGVKICDPTSNDTGKFRLIYRELCTTDPQACENNELTMNTNTVKIYSSSPDETCDDFSPDQRDNCLLDEDSVTTKIRCATFDPSLECAVTCPVTWCLCKTAEVKKCPPKGCTRTQGFWKTHGPDGCRTGNNQNEWPEPIKSNGLTIGGQNYTPDQLCTILNKDTDTGPGSCKNLIAARQYIAAKLNQASGASITAAVQSAFDLLDTFLTDDLLTACVTFWAPGTEAAKNTLDDYNNGFLLGGPPHCDDNNGNGNGEDCVPQVCYTVKADKTSSGDCEACATLTIMLNCIPDYAFCDPSERFHYKIEIANMTCQGGVGDFGFNNFDENGKFTVQCCDFVENPNVNAQAEITEPLAVNMVTLFDVAACTCENVEGPNFEDINLDVSCEETDTTSAVFSELISVKQKDKDLNECGFTVNVDEDQSTFDDSQNDKPNITNLLKELNGNNQEGSTPINDSFIVVYCVTPSDDCCGELSVDNCAKIEVTRDEKIVKCVKNTTHSHLFVGPCPPSQPPPAKLKPMSPITRNVIQPIKPMLTDIPRKRPLQPLRMISKESAKGKGKDKSTITKKPVTTSSSSSGSKVRVVASSTRPDSRERNVLRNRLNPATKIVRIPNKH